MMRETWALVPLKSLDRAKRKLAPALSEDLRKGLVLAMARDVLLALEQSDYINRILLVSSEPEAGSMLRGSKLDVFYSDRDEGINQELESAAVYALSQGADRALIVHGDLPYLNTAAIDLFIKEALQGVVRIANCKTGTGTNLLLTSLPLEIKLKFGRDSHQQFVKEAGAQQLRLETVVDKRLGMDIDNPEDLGMLISQNADTPVPGLATRAFLANNIGAL